MGAAAYAQEALDAEGLPLPSAELDSTPPCEPPDTVTSAAEAATASFTPVDLLLWSAESYPPVSGFLPAWWYKTDSWFIQQMYNGQPTVYYSDFPALWTALNAYVYVQSLSDDDYIGFAVGFQPGDTSNPSADYLLVDWKKNTQWFDFGSPSNTPGSWAYRGLAASHVFGVPTADEFWGHVNFDHPSSDPNSGVQELARGSTLGNTGWWNAWIPVRLEYTPTRLTVYVNSQKQIELTGTFHQGRWAFYDFSQQAVYYVFPTVESLVMPVDIDIKPGSYPNAININSHGVIPIAILGSADFDVTQIDIRTLQFAGLQVNVKGNGAPQCSIEDVSGPDGVPDGFEDLVCQFADDAEAWVPGDGVATLTGKLLAAYGGGLFEGSDEITIVP